MANSEDPDQTAPLGAPLEAESDLSLHCLLRPVCQTGGCYQLYATKVQHYYCSKKQSLKVLKILNEVKVISTFKVIKSHLYNKQYLTRVVISYEIIRLAKGLLK